MLKLCFRFAKLPPITRRTPKPKAIEEPVQATHLVFEEGKCKIFQHRDGEVILRRYTRIGTFLACINSILFGVESAYPALGMMSSFSFGLFSFTSYGLLLLLQIISRRTVHRIYILPDCKHVEIVFFNAFWEPLPKAFAITEFQEPVPSFLTFTRLELTSAGKIWINLYQNEFENIPYYEETLEKILLGQDLTNIKLKK